MATWIGFPAATRWGWELAPSMGYIGQGMIMGPKTAISMLIGAVLGVPHLIQTRCVMQQALHNRFST